MVDLVARYKRPRLAVMCCSNKPRRALSYDHKDSNKQHNKHNKPLSRRKDAVSRLHSLLDHWVKQVREPLYRQHSKQDSLV